MKNAFLNNTAFLVLSCDNYSDLWTTYIDTFEKYWPDCPFDKYFATNHKDIPESSFFSIKIGNDESWSDGVMKVLIELKKKYEFVLITLEDSVLIRKVNNEEFTKIISEFEKCEGNYLKFIKKPKPTKVKNKFFGEIEKGSLYRPTCVYALWNIDVFLDLLKEEENAWEFERFGAVRSDYYDGFYVVNKNFFNILNTVVQGKWVPSELSRLKKIGVYPTISREILTFYEALILSFKTILFKIFTRCVYWKWRRFIVFKLKGYEG
ncbi:hypothetical protein [Labilibaculum antarcticum]|uniref:Uncharacterized protein n=1 Tax=Labilibaculum antarcticum TaxID=1717717 RepID=A0A1Y1CF18_9BACT|nr:hypothetical protein [Labilibaculum antarcticum]BAX78632.1 hypothetical protein ALGA_0237 [Labilibaculum antarcticum]